MKFFEFCHCSSSVQCFAVGSVYHKAGKKPAPFFFFPFCRQIPLKSRRDLSNFTLDFGDLKSYNANHQRKRRGGRERSMETYEKAAQRRDVLLRLSGPLFCGLCLPCRKIRTVRLSIRISFDHLESVRSREFLFRGQKLPDFYFVNKIFA